MFAHYGSVWAEMPTSSFTIVLFRRERFEGPDAVRGADDFIARIAAAGYDYRYFDDLVKAGAKFKWIVSNHVVSGDTSQRVGVRVQIRTAIRNGVIRVLNLPAVLRGLDRKYKASEIDTMLYAPLRIGEYQVRFMYGADISDAWSLDEWNEIYDLFLCHGPNDQKHLSSRFDGETALMGYPRYDGYFSESLSLDGVNSEFEIDSAKLTVLWMPTYDTFNENVCSIPYFAEELAKLKSQFNIIVRPHPISFRLDPQGIELLRSLEFKIDGDPARDMNKMFRVADTVLCDHGGSAFGALYLGKKLVFLRTPTEGNAAVVKESSNLELMEHFPVLDADRVETLGQLLNDSVFWESCLRNGRQLSDKYFANYRGNASRMTAEILLDLHAK